MLPHGEAKRLFHRVTERKAQARLGGGGVASPSPVKKRAVKKAKILKDEAYDADMVVSSGGDGIGRVML